jgi:hypothetical protein
MIIPPDKSYAGFAGIQLLSTYYYYPKNLFLAKRK